MGKCSKNSEAHDLDEGITKVYLHCDAGRVRTNASAEGVGERQHPAKDPRTGLHGSKARPDIRTGIHDTDAETSEPGFTHIQRTDTAARLLKGNKMGGKERRDVC
jgi:hypothetical protein